MGCNSMIFLVHLLAQDVVFARSSVHMLAYARARYHGGTVLPFNIDQSLP